MEKNEIDEQRIEEEMKKVIAEELSLDEEVQLSDQLSLYNINSLSFVKLVVRLETHFDVTFDDDRIAISQYKTFSDLAGYIIKLLSYN